MDDREISRKGRSPIPVWELPKLLTPVHRYRPARRIIPKDRPHFRGILAFIHRNRFVCATQVQRRFSKFLPSDRTSRRHLAEIEALGFVGVVPTTSLGPLAPKIYFVTAKGLARLRAAFNEVGQNWVESVRDRKRDRSVSAQHVLHELLITEFLLAAWETCQSCPEFNILDMQRRSIARHAAFSTVVAGRHTRLQPDSMLLYRERDRGMMVNFIEMDLGTMSAKQMTCKFQRYRLWMDSDAASTYLTGLYSRHGATEPSSKFRIRLVIVGRTIREEQQRAKRLDTILSKQPATLRSRIWMTTSRHILGNVDPRNLWRDGLWARLGSEMRMKTPIS